MKDKTELESLYNLGASSVINLTEIEYVPHVLIPHGASLENLEKLLPSPRRIKAKPNFTDINGFCDYIDEFKEDGSRIFIDDNKWCFNIVFDCHSFNEIPQAGWCDHQATYQTSLAREWTRFKNHHNSKMTQYEFAEFLEDNIEYITKPIKGADLLSMAQDIKIKLKGNIEVEETVAGGMKRLLISDESTIRGTNASKKEIKFPEKMTLNLRVFKNHSTYPIEVYLRMRRTDEGLKFWITIPDTESFEEQAFDNIIKDVKERSGLPTLKGSF